MNKTKERDELDRLLRVIKNYEKNKGHASITHYRRYFELKIETRKQDYKNVDDDHRVPVKDFITHEIGVHMRLFGLTRRLEGYYKKYKEIMQAYLTLKPLLEQANELLQKVTELDNGEIEKLSAKSIRPRSKWVVFDHNSANEIGRLSRNIEQFLKVLPDDKELEKGTLKEIMGINGQISEVWTHLETNGKIQVEGRKIKLNH